MVNKSGADKRHAQVSVRRPLRLEDGVCLVWSSMSMIADSLVLVFTRGVSLSDWERSGLLSREWALYERVVRRYRRVVLVTWGKAEDRAVLVRMLGATPTVRAELVCDDGVGPTGSAYESSIPARVAGVIGADASVLVKTNQMPAGETAVAVRDALRAAGKRVGLIARGGYLWSRFAAYEHGPESASAQSAGRCERTLCRAADLVVGTTQEMVDDLCWRYEIEPSRTVVVPNYVTMESTVRGSAEREAGVVLYAGQLVRRKRVDVLIEAMALLPEDRRATSRLEVIGEGPERAALETLASERGVVTSFTKRLPHAELAERMARCAVYAQASELEGHPKTVIEAMASGAPVVVADSPGLGEVVQNGVTGVRVPGADAEGFATAIGGLLADDDWRDLMGSAAARWSRANFGLDKIESLEIGAHQRAMGAAQAATKAA